MRKPPPWPPATASASAALATLAAPDRPHGRVARIPWAPEHLRAVGPLDPRTYAAALGVDRRTAVRDLQDLAARGLVAAHGATRDRRYALRQDAG